MDPGSRVHRPHPVLRPYVSDYVTYRHRSAPGIHHGLPSGTLTLVLSFDDPVDLAWADRPQERARLWSMVSGLHTQPAHIHHDGRQHGIQLGLTPLGARALLGLPAGALARQVVDLADVLPLPLEELASAADGERVRLLDASLRSVLTLGRGSGTAPELVHAWHLLSASRGTARVEDVAAAVGWGRRHLGRRFQAEFGLGPKQAARVLRFDRSRQLLHAGGKLADVAATAGYADQAHLSREWRELAGYSPTTYLRAEVPFLQDTGDAARAACSA
ncbi:MAG: helix-turn-helix domain-containing protein [Motilibacteraceae bacterium]